MNIRYVTLRYVTLRYVTLCYVMLCYVMLCYVMLCYVMLCCVTLRYVPLRYAHYLVILCYVYYVMLPKWIIKAYHKIQSGPIADCHLSSDGVRKHYEETVSL